MPAASLLAAVALLSLAVGIAAGAALGGASAAGVSSYLPWPLGGMLRACHAAKRLYADEAWIVAAMSQMGLDVHAVAGSPVAMVAVGSVLASGLAGLLVAALPAAAAPLRLAQAAVLAAAPRHAGVVHMNIAGDPQARPARDPSFARLT